MIEVSGLGKRFSQKWAASNVSFEVGKGEILVLLGPSGCGKTTTLRMINRLLDPTTGTIMISGRDVLQMDPYQLRLGIGYVIQDIGLFPHYTIAQNISLVPSILNWSKERINRRIQELLELIQLEPEILDQYPSQLSGGQQQRVGIARALAADPKVILMDEPFGALDPITRVKLRKDFMSLGAMLDKAIVMVTHDVQEAIEMGDKICLMGNGEMKQTGTAKELLFKPKDQFVKAFFENDRLRLEMQVIKGSDIIPELDDQFDLAKDKTVLMLLDEFENSGEFDQQKMIFNAFTGVKKKLQTKFK